MVALLKQKTKISTKEKTRKKYDVANVFRVLERQEGKNAYADQPPPKEQNQTKYGIKTGDKMKPELIGKQDEQMNKK